MYIVVVERKGIEDYLRRIVKSEGKWEKDGERSGEFQIGDK